MMHKKNKGVSMVEVLIALAIFMIMMIPLVSSMLSSMRTTTSAKELQYRNEYARNLMENIKEVPASVLKTESSIKQYLESMGSTDVELAVVSGDATGSSGSVAYNTYQITGSTYLGTEHTKYDFAIDISNLDYAQAQANGTYNMNPNNLTSTYVESLEQDKVALISAPYANYDTPAFDALLTKKMAEIRKIYEKNGDVFNAEEAAGKFKWDSGMRNIHITVKGDESNGYDVSCKLIYSDSCSTKIDGDEIGDKIGTVEYMPYTKHFNVLPNIYLMYNVCVYNGQYSYDFITFDVSGIQKDDEVRVFVIATASEADNAIASGITLPDTSGDATLYKQAESMAGGANRDSAKIGFAGTNVTNLNNLKVYHNFNNGSNNLSITGTTEMNAKFGTEEYISVSPVSYEKSLSDRGLYTIKIRMRESTGNKADVLATEPVLQGSRGGDGID